MKVVLIACFFVVAVSGVDDWPSFKATFNRNYGSEPEELLRKRNFDLNLERIQEHNKRYAEGKETYWVGMNHFGDWSDLELESERGDSIPAVNGAKQMSSSLKLPESVDWRTEGAVSPVGDQGKCNGGWAFSAVGAIEGLFAIQLRKKVILSEQNLLDCSSSYGTTDCKGGAPLTAAFDYVRDKGINAEADYPYSGEAASDCSFVPSASIGFISGSILLEKGNETALQQAVAQGPVSAGMDGGSWTFKFYGGGIYNSIFCNSEHTNHAVLVIGYGSDDDKKDYWIAKNSWGQDWGEKGFFKLSRNDTNMCAIATAASYPNL